MKKRFVLSLVLLTLVLPWSIAVAQEPEPVYTIEWGQATCWDTVRWVGLKVTSETQRLDEIYRIVLYLEVPNYEESKWVFDHLYSYEYDGYTAQSLSALYSTPSNEYALNACVWELSGDKYCVPEKLSPDCPLAETKHYLPAIFN